MECGKAQERERDGPAEYFPNNFFHQRNSCFLTLQECVNSTTLFSLENFGKLKNLFNFCLIILKRRKVTITVSVDISYISNTYLLLNSPLHLLLSSLVSLKSLTSKDIHSQS